MIFDVSAPASLLDDLEDLVFHIAVALLPGDACAAAGEVCTGS